VIRKKFSKVLFLSNEVAERARLASNVATAYTAFAANSQRPW